MVHLAMQHDAPWASGLGVGWWGKLCLGFEGLGFGVEGVGFRV